MGPDMSGLEVLERSAFTEWSGEPLGVSEQQSEMIWQMP